MALDTYFNPAPGGDIAFTVEAPKLKFGIGSLGEVGEDAKALGMTRVALYTDPRVAKLEPVETVVRAIRAAGLGVEVYDRVEVEPTDRSFKAGAAFAREGGFDGFVSVGGGSAMDTAKASNLYATYPADFLAYVNAHEGVTAESLAKDITTALPTYMRPRTIFVRHEPLPKNSNGKIDRQALKALAP